MTALDLYLPREQESYTAHTASSAVLRESNSKSNGVLGGLRERSDDELKRASREAIEEALKEEWDVRDRLMMRIEAMEGNQRKLESQISEMTKNMQIIQTRSDEAYTEQVRSAKDIKLIQIQAKLEADLEGRDGLIERLRARANDAERQAREAIKRTSDQEKSFDTERQALQTQEQHLNQRIRSLLSARQSTPHTPTSQTDTLSSLSEELASLNISHSTLLAQLNTVSKELLEVKTTNTRLQEENEGWEYLLRERTLNGKVLEGGLLSREMSTDERERRKPRRSELEALDEELEMDELHSDLDAQSPIFDEAHDHVLVRDLDGHVVSTSPENGHLVPPRKGRRSGGRVREGEVSRETSPALDLEAELGRVVEPKTAIQPPRIDETEALQAEMKTLKEANKALTLYCSKIIDRIIAQEGFEHILSVDYKTRRMGSRSTSAQSNRPSLRDLTYVSQLSTTEEVSIPLVAEPEKLPAKKSRPISMMVRGLSARAPSPPPPPPPKEAKEEVPVETKSEKRARRGFSLDFRSLGFGSSSAPTPTETKPQPTAPGLKPLTLSARTSPSIPPNPRLSPQPQPQVQPQLLARKLEPHAEDEEDLRERHRMEAALRLMGIDRTSSSVENTTPASFIHSTSYWTGQKVRPESSKSGDSFNSEIRKGTPLSRLSSALGSESPLSPTTELEDVSPEFAVEALKAYDEKEAEHVRALSQGKAQTGYTSPTAGKIRRSSSQRVSSGGGKGKVVKSESISTLWSVGSGAGSRPGSGEVVIKRD